MKRYKPEPLYTTEAAMCAAFIEWVRRFPGWTCYAETHGWDVLLAHADGTQIGVQAKLTLNLSVIAQAIESEWRSWYNGGPVDVGPDFRAVLVPGDRGMEFLLGALGITAFTPRRDAYDLERGNAQVFHPTLAPDPTKWHGGGFADHRWHYCNPTRRHKLPEYVPDVPAGVPSPSPLSEWKIAALKMCAIMELRGHVTRKDFGRLRIDFRRWRENWLAPVPDMAGAWRWRGEFLGFAHQHPVVYPQVLADVRAAGLADAPELVA